MDITAVLLIARQENPGHLDERLDSTAVFQHFNVIILRRLAEPRLRTFRGHSFTDYVKSVTGRQ